MSIDWQKVDRVLVVRLRSIGDTVLATPSLTALRRFLPHAQIDILLEDWVAPLLDGFEGITVVAVGKGTGERLAIARRLRKTNYDVVFNLHGGSTSTFFARAAGARHLVGYPYYRYSFLYNHLLTSSSDFWGREKTHSVEQQLALLGSVGIQVDDRPPSRLAVTGASLLLINKRLDRSEIRDPKSQFALFHPSTAFFTKQWPAANFARVAEHLAARGTAIVAIASKNERSVLDELKRESKVPITTFDDLSLPEITALASRAELFVGNDSGMAHIAAAVGTPSVVIFGSSNRDHWRPWAPTDAVPNEIVFNELACQPCPGYECKEFGEPKCILTITPESVLATIERVLAKATAPR